jgi:predicted MPP superfamily phosphohydrolase
MQAIRHAPSVVKWICSIWFWLSVISIVAMFMLRNSKLSASTGAHLFFEYSTGWLVFTLYMVLCLICFDGFRLFGHPVSHSFPISLGLTAILLSFGYYHYRHPAVRTVHLHIDRPVNEPDSSLKIVAVSDLHLGMGTAGNQLQQYVEMINAQQPDLILIGGDLVDNSIIPVRSRRMETELSKLKARLGIYMVPGNHEYISGIAECEQYIRRETPIHFLRDTVVQLPNGMQLVGRDDRSNSSRMSLAQLMKDTDSRLPVIVIDHQPYELSQAADAGADLLFCGHTHRGQVWPMTWMTDRLFEISHGYGLRGRTHVYVSSGLSLWGPPFRIGSSSEMIVFILSSGRRP